MGSVTLSSFIADSSREEWTERDDWLSSCCWSSMEKILPRSEEEHLKVALMQGVEKPLPPFFWLCAESAD